MKKKILFTLLFLANAFIAFAQGLPPDPGDCDNGAECPLDTWVMIFAISALIITAVYLHKKQRNTAELLNQ
jgi:hypothetical protein